MTPTALAFIEDICQHPSDDTPRLIFADFLEDEGESDHAAFIRTNVELASTPSYLEDPSSGIPDRNPEWKALLARCAAIINLKQNRHPWFPGVPSGWLLKFVSDTHHHARATARVSRGFVSAVECTADEWLENAEELTVQPIERVTLTTNPNPEQAGVLYHRARVLYEQGEVGDTFSFSTRDYLPIIWKRITFTLPKQNRPHTEMPHIGDDGSLIRHSAYYHDSETGAPIPYTSLPMPSSLWRCRDCLAGWNVDCERCPACRSEAVQPVGST